VKHPESTRRHLARSIHAAKTNAVNADSSSIKQPKDEAASIKRDDSKPVRATLSSDKKPN
jgi:hypothetical protein